MVLPSQQAIIIVDGVDEITAEEMRRSFLRNLLSMHEEVLAGGVLDCKIFITSRSFNDITQELKSVPNIERDKERQECLRSLKFDELSTRRDRVEPAVAGTGEWLADDQEYRKWNESDHSSLILIRGKPGSGKSTLAKFILEKKKRIYNIGQIGEPEASTMPEALIADFFYSFRGGENERSHTLMLQSLLFQLLSQDATLFPLFQPIYRAQRPMNSSRWKHKDLKNIFASLPSLQTSTAKPKVYIFVDAMDESIDRGRSETLKLLQALCLSESSRTFKCLVASRQLPADEINDHEWGQIILEQKNRQDIRMLIQSGLENIKKKPGLTNIDFQFAEDYMANHAQGVFLWVSLVMNELVELASTGPSQKELEDSLQTLPSDLNDFYTLIIERLLKKADQDEIAQKTNQAKLNMIEKGTKMLNWVTFAERPLTTKEFQDAIVVPSSPKPFSPDPTFLLKNRVSDLDARIKAYCGPLIEIRTPVVQLLHVTAREYLLRKSECARPFDTDKERGSAEISSCCIRYLRLLASQPQPKATTCWREQDYDNLVIWLAGYPLLNYVLQYLPRHLQNLPGYSAIPTEISLLLQLLQKSDVYLFLLGDWTKAFLGSEDTDPKPKLDCSQSKLRCLLAAAREGLTAVVNSMIQPNTDPEPNLDCSRFKLRCLSAAAGKGLTAVVESMIHLNTDPNKVIDEFGTTALVVSSIHGHSDVVNILLDHNADVTAQEDHYGNALRAASINGHLDVVRMLLDKGANVNAQGGYYGNALQAASVKGYLNVVRLLVERGANVNAQGGHYVNALQAASINGDLTVVRLLLESGANVNAHGGPNGIALQAGYIKYHLDSVRSALDSLPILAGSDYIDMEYQANIIKSDLSAASLLLDGGGEINRNKGRYDNALQAASIRGHSDVVKLLLESGATPL
ncbi:hypothetical protein N7513_000508 [Penicillium frequentans]|nr:hypothetical protein N7513_000508 [Penicillium glabrum]